MSDQNNHCSVTGCNEPMAGAIYDSPPAEKVMVFRFCELHEKPIEPEWRRLTEEEALIFKVMED